VTEGRIREQAEEARRDHYDLLRQRGTNLTRVDGFLSPIAARVEMETVTVRRSSEAVGKSLNDLNALCGGARVAAVIRGGQVRYDLDATSSLSVGDTVVLIGPAESLAAAIKVFSQEATTATGETAAIGD
jgi:K+/H+ antiporter YhaU regulatory subunit KhtT